MAAREKRTEITQDRILRELAKVAFADIKDYLAYRTAMTQVGITDDGDPILDYQPIIELVPSDNVDGTVVQEVRLSDKGAFSFKLQDKMAALDKLARHLGTYNDSPVVNVFNNPFAGLSTEELRKLIKDG
jgi:phage terminase small subunit